MSKDIIPGSDGDLLKWSNNFSENLPGEAKALGLSDEQVSAYQTNCTNIINGINECTRVQAQAKEAVSNKMSILHTNAEALRTGIGQMKKSNGYTEAIGKLLNILSVSDTIDPNTYKPALSAQVFPGHVTIKFTKKGVQGVNIYSQLKGETKWEKLSFDSFSPYVDNRPLHAPGTAEVRQYMAMGVVHDHEIGQMSDIVEVTFGG